MFTIRKLFLFLSLGLLASVPTITFGMNKKELENLSITELDKLFKAENSPTRLKQQILLILLKQGSTFLNTDNGNYHIRDYLEMLPHNQEFLGDLCKANLLRDLIANELWNCSYRSVINTCIECCDHEPLIRKIAATRCTIQMQKLKDFLPQYISKRLPTKKNPFKDIFDKAKEKNKKVYKHFFRRAYLYHLLYRIFLHKAVEEKKAVKILTKINEFIEEPFASNEYNKHEEQDNKERISFLREKFGDFQINIDGEKIKTSKLFFV